jgi:hypothetical protein
VRDPLLPRQTKQLLTLRSRASLLVPDSAAQAIEFMAAAHSSAHLGFNRTLEALHKLQLVNWQGAAVDVRMFVRLCDVCQRRCANDTPIPLHPIVDAGPHRRWVIDLFFLKVRDPKTHSVVVEACVLLCIDGFTKFIRAAVMLDGKQSQPIADQLFEWMRDLHSYAKCVVRRAHPV